MSELAATLRNAVRALADADRSLRRFGAAHHRYALAPPLTAAQLAALEARVGALPDDVRAFATEIAAGGAGPYYGIVPIDRGEALAAPRGAPWARGLPIAHLGCGYLAVLALDGAARGEIWIDARALAICAPIAPSFTAFVVDWIDRVAHARWLDAHVPPGVCPLAAALSGFLAHCEAERGLAAGTIAGADLRAALARLGPGAIEIAATGAAPWFADGERVDPCVACAQLVDSLADAGLAREVVAPGLPPAPLR
ncbi:MAG TPA: SMI1/KNR4 family protein [Kofleriaceae bacterium]|nr:SMI1/KNR4 family protein [Kofleriaceae bacterium]